MFGSRHLVSLGFRSGDILTLSLSLFISIFLFSDGNFLGIESFVLIGVTLLWIILSYQKKNEDNYFNNKISNRGFNYLKVYIILIVSVIIFFTVSTIPGVNKHVIVAFTLGLPVFGIPINFLLGNLKDQLKNKNNNIRYTLVAGVGNSAFNVEKQLGNHYKSGHHIKGFIKCKKEECAVDQNKIVGDLDHIHEYLKSNPVDEIVIALPVKVSKKIRNILTVADYYGVRVKYIPDYQELLGVKCKLTRYGSFDAVNVRQLPLDETNALIIKNSFDKVFSFIALILLLPFFLVLAALIKIDSPGPVFYCPIRIGKAGRAFKVFKFRTMKECDVTTGGRLSTVIDDQRITRLGKLMRKYSLDELPQFLNVLLGEMSVVGPRPHRSLLNQKFQESEVNYMIRHYYKPGITGWAQVNGWRGPTETKEQKSQRTKHDLWYIENWSLMLDLKIIYLTVFSPNTHKSAF